MRNLRLKFYGSELVEVHCRIAPDEAVRVSVRGKTPGAFHGANTFQWTSAVRALALLLVSARIDGAQTVLAGETGSAAASLDYALSKHPSWLVEMFGTDAAGRGMARRLIRRSNPERKRPGPVLLSLNAHLLQPAEIDVEKDGVVVSDPAVLSQLKESLAAVTSCGDQRAGDKPSVLS
jgi:hypothetical protein